VQSQRRDGSDPYGLGQKFIEAQKFIAVQKLIEVNKAAELARTPRR
jgi:hypothetical protein